MAGLLNVSCFFFSAPSKSGDYIFVMVFYLDSGVSSNGFNMESHEYSV